MPSAASTGNTIDELVIVPAWRRPDFLRAVLTRLEVLDDGARHYWMCLDREHSIEVLDTAVEFQHRLGTRVEVRRRRHGYYGNSYNLLTSYREAVSAEAQLIHLVEEDVFIADDYFDFHRRAHELCPGAFAVSACRSQGQGQVNDTPEYDDAVYLANRYQSLGVSFKPHALRNYVVPHIQQRYFANPLRYCTQAFPRSRIGSSFTEQDGLLDRIVEAGELRVVYPAVPRAYHAGFTGYNRLGDALEGAVEENARQLLAMSSEELNARAQSYADHRAISLDAVRSPVTRVIDWPG